MSKGFFSGIKNLFGGANHPIKRVTYSKSGGDLGAYYTLELSADGKLTSTQCEGNGYEEVSKHYALPEETVKKVEKFLAKSGCYKWKDLKQSEYLALDAPTGSVNIDYADGRQVSFNSNQILPTEGVINSLRKLLENAATEQEKMPVYPHINIKKEPMVCVYQGPEYFEKGAGK